MTEKEYAITRRDVLKGLSIGIIGSTVGRRQRVRAAAGDTGEDVDDRPIFDNDAANSGHAPGDSGLTSPTVEPRHFETGARVLSSLAVLDGTVYVGSNTGNVCAYPGLRLILGKLSTRLNSLGGVA